MDKQTQTIALLKRLNKYRYTPDLHSFKAKINGGVVFVECTGENAFYIEAFVYDKDGNETRNFWDATTEEAAKELERLGLDLDSVET